MSVRPPAGPGPAAARRPESAGSFRLWLLIVGFAALSGWLGWTVRHGFGGDAVAPGARVPELYLEDLRTGDRRTVLPPGRVRVLNYWASWCGPCREEMPILQAFAADQAPNGIEVVGIALDDPLDARRFLDTMDVDFPIYIEARSRADSSVKLGNARGVLPFTALIDADGRLLKTKYGSFPDRAALDRWVQHD